MIANRTALASLLVATLVCGAGSASSQDAGAHPDVSTRMVLRCSLEANADSVEVPLQLASLMAAAKPNQEFSPPGVEAPIRIAEYLPLATPRQRIEVDSSPAARPAVCLSIKGPKLSYERCMIADSPTRNRMTSLIATWRYAAAETQEARDRLFAEFVDEPNRAPRLLIGVVDGGPVESVPVVPGRVESLETLGCKVRVLEFFGHYNFDERAGEPVNLSDKRTNPAALVQIEGVDGRKEERWVFARFPDYPPESAGESRYSVSLDCAIEKNTPTPDFVLVVVDGSRHELWTRSLDEVTSRPIAVSEPVDIPGSRYTFQIDSFLPAARLIEEFVATKERRGGVTAVKIEFTNAAGEPDSQWLEMGREYRIALPSTVMTVSFGQKQGS